MTVKKRKAVVIGINKYPIKPLNGCIKDATAVAELLEKDENGDPNFAVKLYKDIETKGKLQQLIEDAFKGDGEAALFYFSGHGYEDPQRGTYLVTPDAKNRDTGVPLIDLVTIANHSKVNNRIIILDCCHSGNAGTAMITGGQSSILHPGVTILTASRGDESAVEAGGQGVFTHYLLEALKGGAADTRGNITPGGIYTYIDRALGIWDQRPVFKTNITEFISLRNVVSPIETATLRKIANYFSSPEQPLPLDPSYEETNSPEVAHELLEPYADKDNVVVFGHLQKFVSLGLVVPVGEKHMYFAAMRRKSCKLTPLGHHYWRLAKEGKI